MVKILVFAGTTEGRQLVEILAGRAQVVACVATEYGRDVLEEGLSLEAGEASRAGADAKTGVEADNIKILSGRLSLEDMVLLMQETPFDAVVDTTHPYALVVTECIRQACGQTDTPYIRLLRQEGREANPQIGGGAGKEAGQTELRKELPTKQAYIAENSLAAAAFLNTTEGPVLLTTGSKELSDFTQVKDFQHRLFARVLPMAEVVKKCEELGFQGRQLICMQGPFSYEMNKATLLQTGAKYLVTKDSGAVGGFDEKLRAAEDLGVCPIIIGRKPSDTGLSLKEVLGLLRQRFGLSLLGSDIEPEATSVSAPETTAVPVSEDCDSTQTDTEQGPCNWFPLFIRVKDKRILVVGGGKIASRRIHTLLDFSCEVTVLAKEADPAIETAAKRGDLRFIKKEYETADLFDLMDGRTPDLVLAITDNRECNHRIFSDCKLRRIPVNIADCREECDFYFPGIVKKGDLVVGVSSCGTNHKLAKRAVCHIRKTLEEAGADLQREAAESTKKTEKKGEKGNL